MKIRRFTTVQRLFHLLLILTFMTQAATGMARLYIETVWGKSLASIFGGYTGCLTVHSWVGVFMLVLFALHILYALGTIIGKKSPHDSLIPRPSDVRDFLRHTGWILGICKEPEYDRWTWWEKFDYWAVFWGMVILGGTGLILIQPLAASRVMAGWWINVALWVHRIEAVLAIGHIVLIHFFIAHLRRSRFPMDMAMFEGAIPLEEAKAERPAWVARLTASGSIDAAHGRTAPLIMRAVYFVFGYAIVVCGAALLIYGLVNAPYVTW